MCRIIFFYVALCLFSFAANADDLSQIAQRIQAAETEETGPASIGAIEFAQKRFYEEFFMTLFEALPSLPKEKQKTLITREMAMAKKLRYAIWNMSLDEWEEFKNKYANEKLVLFESVNCSGYTVGIGMLAGDKINLVKLLDRFTNGFSVSTIPLDESYDFITEWDTFVDKKKEESQKSTGQTIFEPERIRIIGAVSIPFMEFICDQFHATHYNVLAELETVPDSPDPRGKISEIKKIFIDAPFTGNKYSWAFLKEKQGELSFYSRKVDKNEINLYYENGFILKTDANVAIKVPISSRFTKLKGNTIQE